MTGDAELRTLQAELPAPYELIRRDRVDAVLDEALALGEAGADEGTLLWPREAAHVPPGTLCAAVLLAPEEPADRWPELAAVAAVSAGAAIAELCQPLTPLGYRWPDELLLGLDPVGRIGAARSGHLLALSWQIHVTPPPGSLPAFATLTADGGAETSAGEVLGRTCRFFLDWINRWAEEGFEPVRRAWLRRRLLEHPPADDPAGQAVDLDARGNLVLRSGTAEAVRPLGEALGLGEPQMNADGHR